LPDPMSLPHRRPQMLVPSVFAPCSPCILCPTGAEHRCHLRRGHTLHASSCNNPSRDTEFELDRGYVGPLCNSACLRVWSVVVTSLLSPAWFLAGLLCLRWADHVVLRRSLAPDIGFRTSTLSTFFEPRVQGVLPCHHASCAMSASYCRRCRHRRPSLAIVDSYPQCP